MLRITLSKPEAVAKGPAIFLDRDGVINTRRPDDYVLDFSQFEFVPGIRKALKQLGALGSPLILISNQAAVGKGLLDVAGLEEITRRMQQSLLPDGITLAAAYFCTHRADEGCICRKPKPGLLRQAAEDFSIDLGRSVFIGDSQTDVLAAQAAGCTPILLGDGLQNGPGTVAWPANLAIARRPEELLDVAVKCLHELESV
jgi:D-glycero-D-manno-heptose 1,7-bisphosphate phosphatase